MTRRAALSLLAAAVVFGCGSSEPKGRLPVAPVGVLRDKVEMVHIPAGYFVRGERESPNQKSRRKKRKSPKDNLPVRRIYIDSFRIDKFEVTNGAYARFVSEVGHPAPSLSSRVRPWGGNWERFVWEGRKPPPGSNDLPVTLVSWFDAEAYCTWTGKRLPSEAEWEKAARGSDGQAYPWGDDASSGLANFGKTHEGPLPGGSFPGDKSPYGVVDMAGNVAEWVSDYYHPTYYNRAPERNPQGPKRGSLRVVRGGFWRESVVRGRTDQRWKGAPSAKHGGVGFRCAISGKAKG